MKPSPQNGFAKPPSKVRHWQRRTPGFTVSALLTFCEEIQFTHKLFDLAA
jgi:hypothetical protein